LSLVNILAGQDEVQLTMLFKIIRASPMPSITADVSLGDDLLMFFLA
jgi:hypothetical protein